ncbi:MAG: rhodanese-like domain-containing protein [Bacteroidales bacterium]|nr:rhodanese-like domain-containing protein [Bacteroidales bacterium]
MRILQLTAIILFVFHLEGFSQNIPGKCHKNIDPDDFNLLMETKDVVLIDVRLYREFRKERIKDALHASNVEALEMILENIEAHTYILVYCEEGDRSETATEIICKEMSFNKVNNLKGGIIQWKKKGYPIDKEQIKKTTN